MFGFKDMLTLMDSREEDTIVPAAFITGMDIVDKPYYFRDRTAIQRNLSGKDSILDPENGRYYSSGQSVIDSTYPDQHDIRYHSLVGPYKMPVN